MWIYEKKLQYPVNIKEPNAALAKIIITQYGGPYGSRSNKTGRSFRTSACFVIALFPR